MLMSVLGVTGKKQRKFIVKTTSGSTNTWSVFHIGEKNKKAKSKKTFARSSRGRPRNVKNYCEGGSPCIYMCQNKGNKCCANLLNG